MIRFILWHDNVLITVNCMSTIFIYIFMLWELLVVLGLFIYLCDVFSV